MVVVVAVVVVVDDEAGRGRNKNRRACFKMTVVLEIVASAGAIVILCVDKQYSSM
jgi:hypothetical protein